MAFAQVKSDLRQGTLLEIESAPASTQGQPAQPVLLSSAISSTSGGGGGNGRSQRRRACALAAAAQDSTSGDAEGRLPVGPATGECSGTTLRAAPLATQGGCLRAWQHPAAAAAAGADSAAAELAPAQAQAGDSLARGAQPAGGAARGQVCC